MNKNPYCCGKHCRETGEAIGEVRVYPLGAGSNLLMCRACCEHENQYRRERYWPESNWDKLEPYTWM